MTPKQIVVAISIGVGLLHFVTGPGYRGPLSGFVNGYLLDILVPFAMVLLLGVPDRPFPQSRVARAVMVLGVGATVEVLQLFEVPIFGRTFDPLDFLMYWIGVLGAVLFEEGVLSRLEPAHRSDGGGATEAKIHSPEGKAASQRHR